MQCSLPQQNHSQQKMCQGRFPIDIWLHHLLRGLPWWGSGKESACNAEDTGDVGWIPGSGRSPGGGNGNPLQYPCQENPMDRGAWQARVRGVAKSQMQLSAHACTDLEDIGYWKEGSWKFRTQAMGEQKQKRWELWNLITRASCTV